MFRYRFHGDRRLVLQKISEDAWKIVCILTRGDKIYDNKNRNSELDRFAKHDLNQSKVAELEQRLGLRDIDATPSEPKHRETKPEQTYAEDAPPVATTEPESVAIVIEPLEVEPMEDWELVSLFATPDLLRRFADLAHWPIDLRGKLLDCSTSNEVSSLPGATPEQLESLIGFLTENGDKSDIERCWLLPDEDLRTLAERSLGSFLLFLDDDQKALVNKPLNVGPFLVRGTAGTGKSTVCLYRMRRMIEQRTGETLFDGAGKPRYLFVTFTNQLVMTSKNLFHEICRDMDLDGVSVEFKTVDKIFSELAEELSSKQVWIPKVIDGQEGLYRSIVDRFSQGLNREKSKAIGDEIEEVIFDRGISNPEDYKNANRRGRSQINRDLVWKVYEELVNHLENLGLTTWAGRKRRILDAISDLEEQIPAKKFSGLMIDEAQDLGMTSLAIMAKCAVSTKVITIASDTGQSIYRRGPNWKSISEGFTFNKGNSFELKRSYRMSKNIFNALEPLRLIQNENMRNEKPDPVFSGATPQMHFCDSKGHARLAAKIIKEQVELNRFHLGTFVVLIRSTIPAHALVLCRTFEEENVPFLLHDKKTPVDIEAAHVHFITPQSAKGLEFPNVIVPWPESLGAITAEEETNAKSHRILYVACSRAAENLWLLRHPSSWMDLCSVLQEDLWEVTRHEKYDPDLC